MNISLCINRETNLIEAIETAQSGYGDTGWPPPLYRWPRQVVRIEGVVGADLQHLAIGASIDPAMWPDEMTFGEDDPRRSQSFGPVTLDRDLFLWSLVEVP